MIIVTSLVLLIYVYIHIPKPLKQDKFAERWKELQKLCNNKNTWHQAIQIADELLGSALKKRKFKGSSTGERLVSAQRILSNNDSTWFAHNLYKKIKADPDIRLKEGDTKKALVGFRQALRDLGALPDAKSN
jgi:hypothetical protein